MDLRTTIQLDGSGFDRTQHYEIKNIIENRIYRWVAENCHIHVDRKWFLKHATAEWRKVKLLYRHEKRLIKMGCIIQRGKRFSGERMTTFGNTLNMAIYNKYVMYKAGVKTYKILAKVHVS